ncbi:cystathionine gamma-lyase [bacterium]|nr:cystathionine gamma-lyase [bacterium]|tara:strand:- start:7607 stop:8878 length:1272 start_codon:yes stop_codon:yes gene_type:complete
MSKNSKRYSKESRLIHGEMKTSVWDYSHNVVPPLSSNSTFRLDSSERGSMGFEEYANNKNNKPIYIYDRLEEPTTMMLEQRLAEAEGGDQALTFASGMAAISTTLLALIKSGQRIITHHILYGCTDSLLRDSFADLKIDVTRVNMCNIKEIQKNITKETRIIYLETPLNPTLEMMDIPSISSIVKKENAKRDGGNKIYLIVDNTFMTPWGQRPIHHGADIVVHSLTKAIGGYGTDTAGAAIVPNEIYSKLQIKRKDFGGMLSSRSAWSILTYGIPTLPLRVKKQQESAKKIAEYLESHPKVKNVKWPGLRSFKGQKIAKKQMQDPEGNFFPGFMIYFEIKSNKQNIGSKFVNFIAKNSYSITLAVSLGNIKTLIECPFSMTHSVIPEEEKLENNLDQNGIRLSVGLESPEDLKKDLEAAFSSI